MGSATKLLATVMVLPLIDGIFPALVVAGVLSTATGVVETGILIFGGSATAAVILAEMDGDRRDMVTSVLLIGAVIIPLAALEAAEEEHGSMAEALRHAVRTTYVETEEGYPAVPADIPRDLRDGYAALIPRDSTWQNGTPARTLLALPRYRPVADASAVTCPSLVVAGTEDEIVPYRTAERLADELPDSSLVALPIGHFDAWDDRFAEVLAHEVAFLDAVFERP